ncbi:hypothetical protein KJ903_01625 [Patescibacteria group bacterium]|nr:hypothetical protein [Patescibacteria group bacterium]
MAQGDEKIPVEPEQALEQGQEAKAGTVETAADLEALGEKTLADVAGTLEEAQQTEDLGGAVERAGVNPVTVDVAGVEGEIEQVQGEMGQTARDAKDEIRENMPGEGKGESESTTERQEFRSRESTLEFVSDSRQFFAERFADDPETQRVIDQAIDLLAAADEENYREVGYHNPDHVLSMARNGMLALDNIRQQRPEISVPQGFDKIMALAAILHDMGYYSRDEQFDTMKVDHETRSKQYIEDQAEGLGLSADEVRSAQIIVEGTRFATPLLHIEDIVNPAETQIPAEQQAVILSKYGIDKKLLTDLNDQEQAALLGASIAGTLDILGADNNYLTGVAELQREFGVDKRALKKHLDATIGGVEGKASETAIKGAADGGNQAAGEYMKIPLAQTPLDQVKNSKFFYQFAVPNRISKTGLVEADGAGMLVAEGSLLGEGIVGQARANQAKVFAYFDNQEVPAEVAHLVE